MTSTNDGTDVKRSPRPASKSKTQLIEVYKSLDATLSDHDCPFDKRLYSTCEAWKQIFRLCSAAATELQQHLLEWIHKHTANLLLQNAWLAKANDEKDCHKQKLETAIEQCFQTIRDSNKDDGTRPWVEHIKDRGNFFKRISSDPWSSSPVLKQLMDDSQAMDIDDETVLKWLTEERGSMIVCRVRRLAASKCYMHALSLTSSLLDRIRKKEVKKPAESGNLDEGLKEDLGASDPGALWCTEFAQNVKSGAGFTLDVLLTLTDAELVLLHKVKGEDDCIARLKVIPLTQGSALIDRLNDRFTKEKHFKLWRNAQEVAILAAQMLIARCMICPRTVGPVRAALYWGTCALACRMPSASLQTTARLLAAPARSAHHLHTFTIALAKHCKADMRQFVCEMYTRAITAGMNELEKLKANPQNEIEIHKLEKTLSEWFVQLAELLRLNVEVSNECVLTAFSVHPSQENFERVKRCPIIERKITSSDEAKEEDLNKGSGWASDSKARSIYVKTSETIGLKWEVSDQLGVVSEAVTECKGLDFSPDMCRDLEVLLRGPRIKTLSWLMERAELLRNCTSYMEKTQRGTRSLTTELRYLHLKPHQLKNLKDEEDDNPYGIERGYEHCLHDDEVELKQDAFNEHSDQEIIRSRPSSDESDYKWPFKDIEEEDPLALPTKKKVIKKRKKPKNKEQPPGHSSVSDAPQNKQKTKKSKDGIEKKVKSQSNKEKRDNSGSDNDSQLSMQVADLIKQLQNNKRKKKTDLVHKNKPLPEQQLPKSNNIQLEYDITAQKSTVTNNNNTVVVKSKGAKMSVDNINPSVKNTEKVPPPQKDHKQLSHATLEKNTIVQNDKFNKTLTNININSNMTPQTCKAFNAVPNINKYVKIESAIKNLITSKNTKNVSCDVSKQSNFRQPVSNTVGCQTSLQACSKNPFNDRLVDSRGDHLQKLANNIDMDSKTSYCQNVEQTSSQQDYVYQASQNKPLQHLCKHKDVETRSSQSLESFTGPLSNSSAYDTSTRGTMITMPKNETRETIDALNINNVCQPQPQSKTYVKQRISHLLSFRKNQISKVQKPEVKKEDVEIKPHQEYIDGQANLLILQKRLNQINSMTDNQPTKDASNTKHLTKTYLLPAKPTTSSPTFKSKVPSPTPINNLKFNSATAVRSTVPPPTPTKTSNFIPVPILRTNVPTTNPTKMSNPKSVSSVRCKVPNPNPTKISNFNTASTGTLSHPLKVSSNLMDSDVKDRAPLSGLIITYLGSDPSICSLTSEKKDNALGKLQENNTQAYKRSDTETVAANVLMSLKDRSPSATVSLNTKPHPKAVKDKTTRKKAVTKNTKEMSAAEKHEKSRQNFFKELAYMSNHNPSLNVTTTRNQVTNNSLHNLNQTTNNVNTLTIQPECKTVSNRVEINNSSILNTKAKPIILENKLLNFSEMKSLCKKVTKSNETQIGKNKKSEQEPRDISLEYSKTNHSTVKSLNRVNILNSTNLAVAASSKMVQETELRNKNEFIGKQAENAENSKQIQKLQAVSKVNDDVESIDTAQTDEQLNDIPLLDEVIDRELLEEIRESCSVYDNIENLNGESHINDSTQSINVEMATNIENATMEKTHIPKRLSKHAKLCGIARRLNFHAFDLFPPIPLPFESLKPINKNNNCDRIILSTPNPKSIAKIVACDKIHTKPIENVEEFPRANITRSQKDKTNKKKINSSQVKIAREVPKKSTSVKKARNTTKRKMSLEKQLKQYKESKDDSISNIKSSTKNIPEEVVLSNNGIETTDEKELFSSSKITVANTFTYVNDGLQNTEKEIDSLLDFENEISVSTISKIVKVAEDFKEPKNLGENKICSDSLIEVAELKNDCDQSIGNDDLAQASAEVIPIKPDSKSTNPKPLNDKAAFIIPTLRINREHNQVNDVLAQASAEGISISKPDSKSTNSKPLNDKYAIIIPTLQINSNQKKVNEALAQASTEVITICKPDSKPTNSISLNEKVAFIIPTLKVNMDLDFDDIKSPESEFIDKKIDGELDQHKHAENTINMKENKKENVSVIPTKPQKIITPNVDILLHKPQQPKSTIDLSTNVDDEGRTSPLLQTSKIDTKKRKLLLKRLPRNPSKISGTVEVEPKDDKTYTKKHGDKLLNVQKSTSSLAAKKPCKTGPSNVDNSSCINSENFHDSESEASVQETKKMAEDIYPNLNSLERRSVSPILQTPKIGEKIKKKLSQKLKHVQEKTTSQSKSSVKESTMKNEKKIETRSTASNELKNIDKSKENVTQKKEDELAPTKEVVSISKKSGSSILIANIELPTLAPVQTMSPIESDQVNNKRRISKNSSIDGGFDEKGRDDEDCIVIDDDSGHSKSLTEKAYKSKAHANKNKSEKNSKNLTTKILNYSSNTTKLNSILSPDFLESLVAPVAPQTPGRYKICFRKVQTAKSKALEFVCQVLPICKKEANEVIDLLSDEENEITETLTYERNKIIGPTAHLFSANLIKLKQKCMVTLDRCNVQSKQRHNFATKPCYVMIDKEGTDNWVSRKNTTSINDSCLINKIEKNVIVTSKLPTLLKLCLEILNSPMYCYRIIPIKPKDQSHESNALTDFQNNDFEIISEFKRNNDSNGDIKEQINKTERKCISIFSNEICESYYETVKDSNVSDSSKKSNEMASNCSSLLSLASDKKEDEIKRDLKEIKLNDGKRMNIETGEPQAEPEHIEENLEVEKLDSKENSLCFSSTDITIDKEKEPGKDLKELIIKYENQITIENEKSEADKDIEWNLEGEKLNSTENSIDSDSLDFITKQQINKSSYKIEESNIPDFVSNLEESLNTDGLNEEKSIIDSYIKDTNMSDSSKENLEKDKPSLSLESDDKEDETKKDLNEIKLKEVMRINTVSDEPEAKIDIEDDLDVEKLDSKENSLGFSSKEISTEKEVDEIKRTEKKLMNTECDEIDIEDNLEDKEVASEENSFGFSSKETSYNKEEETIKDLNELKLKEEKLMNTVNDESEAKKDIEDNVEEEKLNSEENSFGFSSKETSIDKEEKMNKDLNEMKLKKEKRMNTESDEPVAKIDIEDNLEEEKLNSEENSFGFSSKETSIDKEEETNKDLNDMKLKEEKRTTFASYEPEAKVDIEDNLEEVKLGSEENCFGFSSEGTSIDKDEDTNIDPNEVKPKEEKRMNTESDKTEAKIDIEANLEEEKSFGCSHSIDKEEETNKDLDEMKLKEEKLMKTESGEPEAKIDIEYNLQEEQLDSKKSTFNYSSKEISVDTDFLDIKTRRRNEDGLCKFEESNIPEYVGNIKDSFNIHAFSEENPSTIINSYQHKSFVYECCVMGQKKFADVDYQNNKVVPDISESLPKSETILQSSCINIFNDRNVESSIAVNNNKHLTKTVKATDDQENTLEKNDPVKEENVGEFLTAKIDDNAESLEIKLGESSSSNNKLNQNKSSSECIKTETLIVAENLTPDNVVTVFTVSQSNTENQKYEDHESHTNNELKIELKPDTSSEDKLISEVCILLKEQPRYDNVAAQGILYQESCKITNSTSQPLNVTNESYQADSLALVKVDDTLFSENNSSSEKTDLSRQEKETSSCDSLCTETSISDKIMGTCQNEVSPNNIELKTNLEIDKNNSCSDTQSQCSDSENDKINNDTPNDIAKNEQIPDAQIEVYYIIEDESEDSFCCETDLSKQEHDSNDSDDRLYAGISTPNLASKRKSDFSYESFKSKIRRDSDDSFIVCSDSYLDDDHNYAKNSGFYLPINDNENDITFALNDSMRTYPSPKRRRKRRIKTDLIYSNLLKKRKLNNAINLPKNSANDVSCKSEFNKLKKYNKCLNLSMKQTFLRADDEIDMNYKIWPLHQQNSNEMLHVIEEDCKSPLFQDLEDFDIKNVDSKEPYEQCREQITKLGFGEGSDRVNMIGNVRDEKFIYSAATLSDVKQQPLRSFYDFKNNQIFNDNKENIRKHILFSQIDKKVKSFFKKANQLSGIENWKSNGCKHRRVLLAIPGMQDTSHMIPNSVEQAVHVVQVGQLPVNVSTPNNVSCSQAPTSMSPNQTSDEPVALNNKDSVSDSSFNDSNADMQNYSSDIKADDKRSSVVIKQNDIESNDLNCQNVTENCDTVDERMRETSSSLESSQSISADSPANILITSNSGVITQSLKIDSLSEGHAKSVATTASTPNSPRTFINILSQKIIRPPTNLTTQQLNVNTTFPKTNAVNTMTIQQALAQILPPPLNQTQTGESNQHSQVLHFVPGKPAANNRAQNSGLTNQNSPQLLHIVQNKVNSSSISTNGSQVSPSNTFSGVSFVEAGVQGANQVLHLVNAAANQAKNSATTQLLKRVNLLTGLTNVQGGNDQKMLQFLCKSADGKSLQLNAGHQRSMVLRLHPIETTQQTQVQMQSTTAKTNEVSDSNLSITPPKEPIHTQEIKSRSMYEDNYAKFIQNSTGKSVLASEKSTSLPKFNQAFGKTVFQEGKTLENNNDVQNVEPLVDELEKHESPEQKNDSMSIDNISHLTSSPLLIRKATPTTQTQTISQVKTALTPMNIQGMPGGVIYTRQIPVNIGGGQTINLITVPSTELLEDGNQKQEIKFTTNSEVESQPVIKLVPHPQNVSFDANSGEQSTPQNNEVQANALNQVLAQMRIKLPMLSKTPQMVSGARLVRPFLQIQRNVLGGANQPVYQQLVLTTAPTLGQQTIRLPQPQAKQVKVSENQSDNNLSTSTLEQLREFDMVLEQVKERSTVQPNSSLGTVTKLQEPPENVAVSSISETPVLYSISGNQALIFNRKTVTQSPDSSEAVQSPSSTQVVHLVSDSSGDSSKLKIKTKPKPSKPNVPPSPVKTAPIPPKTSTQKPLEDEQTTQRILYILAEYKEQVENSPDKDKPAPRRRTNPPTNPGSSKKKKSSGSSGSRKPGSSSVRESSPVGGSEDLGRTMGSEDSSCGTSQGDCAESCTSADAPSPQGSPRKTPRKLTFESEIVQPTTPVSRTQHNVIVADGQTIALTRTTAGKPTTAVLMPANYLLPVSMMKGGQQIAIVTNRGPKLLTMPQGEGGAANNTLLLQRLIGSAGLKPILTRPGVRHVRLPTAAVHNLQQFNVIDQSVQEQKVEGKTESSEVLEAQDVWSETNKNQADDLNAIKDEQTWNLPATSEANDYTNFETSPAINEDQVERTVLEDMQDEQYNADLEAQRILEKMFDAVDTRRVYLSSGETRHYDTDITANSDCEDKSYTQVMPKKELANMTSVVSHGQSYTIHQKSHQPSASTLHSTVLSAAALRNKYAIIEHELRLQKSLSEECEDLGVDSPSASDLFPEAELLFAASPAQIHEHSQDTSDMMQHQHQQHINLSTNNSNGSLQNERLESLGSMGPLSPDTARLLAAGAAALHEDFARSHPNTTFHSEPVEDEMQQYAVSSGVISTATSRQVSEISVPQHVVSQLNLSQGTIIQQHNMIQHQVESPPQQVMSPHQDCLSPHEHDLSEQQHDLSQQQHDLSQQQHISLSQQQVVSEVQHHMLGDARPNVIQRAVHHNDDESASSPERYWESNDSNQCDSQEETDTEVSPQVGSVIKTCAPRTYLPARKVSGKRVPEFSEGSSRRLSNRGVVKRGCHCCNGNEEPRAKKPKPKQRPST